MDNLLISIRFLLLIWLTFFLAPVVMAQSGGLLADDLSVSIKPADNGVEFVLTNNTGAPVSLLRWETPLEAELTQDVFHVTQSDGGNRNVYAKPAMFSGKLFKRGEPGPEDFINIAVGQSVSAVVQLADYYQLSDEGGYQVSFHGEFHMQVHSHDEPESRLQSQAQSQAQSHAQARVRSLLSHHHHEGLDSVAISTDPVSIDLTPAPEVLYAQAAGYSGCSATQLAELPLDFDASEVITREAREALEGLAENERAASPRYQRWFGAYESARFNSVVDLYRKTETLMASSQVEFLCDCDDPFFAFIRRTEPFKVNLCRAYWQAARTGTDSRAGTIVHEISHFNEIGGTEDFVYGTGPASNLALSSPANAVNNADSVEYFAENTPFLEISAGVAPPGPSAGNTTLALGTSVSGSVLQSARDNFQVTGADEIRVTTLSGDADLFVYSDSGFSNQICVSQNQPSDNLLDACDTSAADTVYVQVLGFGSATSYNIVAIGDAPVPPAPLEPTLQAGQSQTSAIASNEWQLYTVTGASSVQIESLSGDADLYVYSDARRTIDSVICDSRNNSSSSTIDNCAVSGTVYVGVFGTRSGQYSIAALTSSSAGPVVVTQSGDNASGGGGGLIGLRMLVLLLLSGLLSWIIKSKFTFQRTGK